MSAHAGEEREPDRGAPGRWGSRVRHGGSLRAAAALLVLLVAATLVGVFFTARSVDRDRRFNLERRAAGVTDAIGQRLTAYGEVLYGIRGLFRSRTVVSRQAFRDYARSLEVQARLPGTQTVSFADAVQGFDRRSYEAAVRLDARRSVSPYPAGFRIMPVGDRASYVVISYLEPVEGNEAVFGLDLLSEPNRRDAVGLTKQTGRLVATAPLTLVQPPHDRAFLLLLAARNVGGALIDPRNGRFEGAVSGVVRVRDFMAGVFQGAPTGAELEVYDAGRDGAPTPSRPSAASLIYDSDNTPDAFRPSHGGQLARTSLVVGGRRWVIYYVAHAPLSAGATARAPWLVGGAGLLVSLLAAALVYAISTRRERAEALAADMTVGLRRTREELERSNAELERFAYVASHDLQEPLNTVSGFLELFERRYASQLDERANQYLEHAASASKHGTQLIRDLLEYSRVALRSEGEARVDLNEAWDRAVEILSGQIDVARADVARAQLPEVAVAAVHMVRVFQNLISNSLKYRSADAPVIRATADRRDGFWHVCVSDQGIGIAPEDQERVFGLFKRLHNRDEYPGTGMGLAMVKRIVESTGGRIWVESEVDRGATFHLELPAHSGAAGAEL